VYDVEEDLYLERLTGGILRPLKEIPELVSSEERINSDRKTILAPENGNTTITTSGDPETALNSIEKPKIY
jgi:hypothetical protein